MNGIFDRVIETSWQASVLAGLILLIQWIFQRKLSPTWRCAMWLLVLARLIIPLVPQSRFSMFGSWTQPQPTSTESGSTKIVYGIVPETTKAALHENPAPSLAPSRLSVLRPLLISFWPFTSAFLLLRLVVSHVRFVTLLRRVPSCTNVHIQSALDECCALLRLNSIPHVVESSLVQVPAVTGVLRPVILLPPAMLEGIPPHRLRFVLLHELIHVKRRDLLIEWLVAVVKAIHWFNPLLWYAFARYRADRELACDAQVLALSDRDQREAYGHTLIHFVQRLHRPMRLTPAVAMVQGRSSLRRRILAIAHPVVGSRHWSLLIGLLLLVIAVATCTKPNNSSPVAADSSDPNTRVYNIGDLVFPNLRDDEIKTDEQGWPVVSTQPAPQPEQVRLTAEIVKLIEDTVDPSSWTDRGGSSGSITERDGQLVIKQSPANHDQIERLLAQVRSTRGLQIVVEARFLTSDGAMQQLTQIVGPDVDLNKAPTLFLTDEQSQALLRAVQAQKDSTTLSAPRLMLFNGQRAYVMVASEKAYVGDFTEKDGKYEPVIKTIKSGSVFDCQAIASADHKYITLSLRPHLARLIAMSPAPWPKAPAGRQDLMVQVPMMETVSYSTRVSVPDGGWIITAWSAGPAMGTAKNPLMMVRARLIEQREAGTTTAPVLSR